MDLVLKARGVRITDQVRRVTEQKLTKLERLEPRVSRVEVELIEERASALVDARRDYRRSSCRARMSARASPRFSTMARHGRRIAPRRRAMLRDP